MLALSCNRGMAVQMLITGISICARAMLFSLQPWCATSTCKYSNLCMHMRLHPGIDVGVEWAHATWHSELHSITVINDPAAVPYGMAAIDTCDDSSVSA